MGKYGPEKVISEIINRVVNYYFASASTYTYTSADEIGTTLLVSAVNDNSIHLDDVGVATKVIRTSRRSILIQVLMKLEQPY